MKKIGSYVFRYLMIFTVFVAISTGTKNLIGRIRAEKVHVGDTNTNFSHFVKSKMKSNEVVQDYYATNKKVAHVEMLGGEVRFAEVGKTEICGFVGDTSRTKTRTTTSVGPDSSVLRITSSWSPSRNICKMYVVGPAVQQHRPNNRVSARAKTVRAIAARSRRKEELVMDANAPSLYGTLYTMVRIDPNVWGMKAPVYWKSGDPETVKIDRVTGLAEFLKVGRVEICATDEVSTTSCKQVTVDK